MLADLEDEASRQTTYTFVTASELQTQMSKETWLMLLSIFESSHCTTAHF